LLTIWWPLPTHFCSPKLQAGLRECTCPARPSVHCNRCSVGRSNTGGTFVEKGSWLRCLDTKPFQRKHEPSLLRSRRIVSDVPVPR
jgi:hypothetical protein